MHTINYAGILNDPKMSAITKLTATKIMKNPYMTLRDFFQGLSNSDITVLELLAGLATEQDDIEAQCDLFMMTEMLSRAEGVESDDIEVLTGNLNYFLVLITIVSLNRKGVVDIKWENMSFGEDMRDKELAILRQQ